MDESTLVDLQAGGERSESKWGHAEETKPRRWGWGKRGGREERSVKTRGVTTTSLLLRPQSFHTTVASSCGFVVVFASAHRTLAQEGLAVPSKLRFGYPSPSLPLPLRVQRVRLSLVSGRGMCAMLMVRQFVEASYEWAIELSD